MLENSENIEKKEELVLSKLSNLENIKNQVIDRLLDDIDISKVSKYPDLKEFVNKYSESPEKLEKDINDLPDSKNLLNSENESILETIKEKVKKPLAIVCLLGVLMTGSGAIEDQNRDSKLTQLANNLGINNVVHAEEEAPDWGAMNETLEEENEELKEENDKQEERIKEMQQRLEMLREINEQLDEDIDNLDEDIKKQEQTKNELNKSIEDTNKEFRNHIKKFAENIDNISNNEKQWAIDVLEKFDIFEDKDKSQEYLELFENH